MTVSWCVGGLCTRCGGKATALFSSTECVNDCHLDPDIYTPKEDPRAAHFRALTRSLAKAYTGFSWGTFPLPP